MKNKFLNCLLALLMIIAMLPAGVLAALPDGVPSSLEAPTIKSIELKHNEDGRPYFEAQVYFPQSVLDLDSEAPGGGSVFWDYSVKVDDGAWGEFGGGGYINVYTGGEDGEEPVSAGNFAITFDPIDEGSLTSVDIKNHIYSYQLHVYYDYYEGWPDIQPIYSPVSNAVTIGSGNFYSDASTWAEAELKKANELGLIPDVLKGVDMTKPITREEFCELAVLLYEKVTKSTDAPATSNPFTDTSNNQILKAYALGITTGTSATTFSPKTLINREQCATMLFRAIKAIAPNADYSIGGVKDFPDQKDISSWAVEGTKYMSRLEIIKGDESGNFMPKATTTAQTAAGYGMATREAAILMTVRTYETMD
ncbi:MAG: S-layer homology domain-containing protein [Clostridiaceae bacterium]|nr:S-layer homology domain-containing protein [Clostridiaceae bacterium]